MASAVWLLAISWAFCFLSPKWWWAYFIFCRITEYQRKSYKQHLAKQRLWSRFIKISTVKPKWKFAKHWNISAKCHKQSILFLFVVDYSNIINKRIVSLNVIFKVVIIISILIILFCTSSRQILICSYESTINSANKTASITPQNVTKDHELESGSIFIKGKKKEKLKKNTHTHTIAKNNLQ